MSKRNILLSKATNMPKSKCDDIGYKLVLIMTRQSRTCFGLVKVKVKVKVYVDLYSASS